MNSEADRVDGVYSYTEEVPDHVCGVDSCTEVSDHACGVDSYTEEDADRVGGMYSDTEEDADRVGGVDLCTDEEANKVRGHVYANFTAFSSPVSDLDDLLLPRLDRESILLRRAQSCSKGLCSLFSLGW